MEIQKSKALEEASYDIDTEYESAFRMINGANFRTKDGIKYVNLDSSQPDCAEDEVASWLVIIKQGLKIGEVMDRVPYGRFNKLITGLGATTLEIENQERNSIIVVPTKSLAYNKSKSANLNHGVPYSMYVGSPMKDSGQADRKHIEEYLNARNGLKKKFLVVADSLSILIETLQKIGIDVYNDYFLMVDEIDTMQSDSVYRPKLENVIDHYLKFDHRHRCMVSATMNVFSNPELEHESCVTTIWREMPKRDINLIYTNYVDDIAVAEIKRKLEENENEKILIAYNSLDGILNILQQLGAQWKSQVGILCSERSDDKISGYLDDTDNVIDEHGNLGKRIVFMTCAYFAGIDIMDKCHLISITSHLQPFTYLSVGKLAQIAGRCRNGNLSETIIYDIPQNIEQSEYQNKDEYRTHLVKKADSYSGFMNATRNAAQENEELQPLTDFIDSFVNFSAKAKVADDYPTKILRQNHLSKDFVPAYFNIDALVEDWEMRNNTYSNDGNLYKQLTLSNNVHKETRFITKEEHDSDTIIRIKENEKERKSALIEELKPKLLAWHSQGMDDVSYKQLFGEVDKGIKEKFCDTFRKLCPYIDAERLLTDLTENWDDGRKLRNYNNAVVFWAMEDSHPFKAQVLARFNYSKLQSLPERHPERKVSIVGKKQKMKDIFLSCLKLPQNKMLTEDTMTEFFKCFFKTQRASGGRYDRIVGLNPEDLPLPKKFIDNEANLFELFSFPK